MRTVALPSGEKVPALGMGTWRMGENMTMRAEEIETLRLGLELGITLIDTAEMYGEGRTEELVGEALSQSRDQAFIVSKVYPHNASRSGTIAACERSLRRLRTDRIDLYLLHWRGSVPLEETMEAFTSLQSKGKIRYYGVSNFDVDDIEELWRVPGGSSTTANQVLYNLRRRGIEWSLLPWLRERRVPIMAYSPIEQGRLTHDKTLAAFARKSGITPTQAALAWLFASNDIAVVPKTGNRSRLQENLRALDHELTPDQLLELDRLFPPPSKRRPLEMI
jgi:diketogulonate reductase-like aldo/keto reductase